MLSLDIDRVTKAHIGPTHGLDCHHLFSIYEKELSNYIAQLYSTKDEPGQWKKWLNLGHDGALREEIERYAASVKGQFDDLVVLGIGG